MHCTGMSIHDVYWALTRLVSEGREIADADLVKRYGPSKEEHDEARQDWFVKAMPTLSLDWFVCAMGLASIDQVEDGEDNDSYMAL